MSEIFISHSSKDNVIADELKHRLETQGHKSVFLDFDPDIGIPPGCNWEQELYHKLRSCQAIIVLCSKDSMASKWVFVEITHAKALGKHIIPIKVRDCTIETVLIANQVLDLTSNQEESYQQLWRGLRVAGLDPANAFDWDGSRPPYPGLMAFQEADAAVFFGRDNEIQEGLELLNRLRQFGGARIVMVLGSSGSGKSSLVLAGLLPRIRRNKDQWLVVDPFRPQEHPFQELAMVLAAAFAKYGQARDWRDICNSLQQAAATEPLSDNNLNGLAKDLLILANQREAKVLLVIDQTEELLGLTDSASVRDFLPLVRASLDTPNSPLMVICTMRSDFLGDFQQHPSTGDLALEDLWVGPMSVDRLVQVIEGPAEKAGIELEAGLTEVLVQDIETEDALPLLAFTLRELYERYGDDRMLTVEEYRDKLGGLAGSVAKAADTVFKAKPLSEDEQADLRKSFLSMVRINEKGQFARYTARWAELPERIHPLLERFVQARLLVSRGEGRDRMLEVAHETIFSSWAQLRKWLDEDREFLLWRKRLDGACREWERTEQHRSTLLAGSALAEGQNWLDRESDQLTPKESHFVRSSLEAAAKRRRRNVLLLSTAIIFLAAIAVGGLILWQQAEQQTLKAEDQARVAIAGEWLGKDPTKAALVLLEVKKPDETVFATERMREVLGQRIAVYEFRGHKGFVMAASFSPSGDRVVTASWDGTARIWQADGSGEPVILEGHTGWVYTASFSPSGDRVVTASNDGTARIWQADGSGEPIILEGHTERIKAASFSPSGDRVLTASEDHTARIWQADGSGESIILKGHTDSVTAASFSPSGDRVVTASNDGTARIWQADGSGEPVILEGHTWLVIAASFSPSGDRVLTTSEDHTARIWQADGSGEPVILKGHTNPVYAASFSPSGDRVVTASWDGTARIWQADGSGEPVILKGHTNPVYAASFSPSGDRVVTASFDYTARIWQADGSGDPIILKGHTDAVAAASFSPSSDRVVTASWDGTARIWQADGSGEPVILKGHTGLIYTASFGPSGDRVVTASSDGTARIWQADGSGEPIILKGHTDWVNAASFSLSGDRVVTASNDGTARIWQADGSGEPIILKGHTDWVNAASFSPSSDRVVTASWDGTARIWQVDGSDEPVILEGHTSPVAAASFSPSGDRIVTASSDETARIWQADGSGEPIILEGHERVVMAASFSPSSDRVLTASWDGTARIWSLLSASDLEKAIKDATTMCLDPEFRVRSLGESQEEATRKYQQCEQEHGRNP